MTPVARQPWTLAATAAMVMLFALSSYGRVITVGPAGTFPTIASAIAAAEPRDTVEISKDHYHESGLRIEKPLTLKGIDWPVVDASTNEYILELTGSGILVTGIEFRNAPLSFIKENAAVRLTNATDCEIRNNRFIDNYFAVYLSHSSRCRITHNVITGSAPSLMTAGNGIHLWNCHSIAIESNRIRGHRDGIYLEFSTQGVIHDNWSEGNLRYGLHFMYSDSCRYERNHFVRNGAGVAVMYTRHVDMEDNHFEDSWGGAAYGILLKDITDSNIRGNYIVRNSIGILMEGANRILVKDNKFEANGWALKIMANCVGSVISDNDFIDNSFQVATNSRETESSFDGNYWSTYRGIDLNRDGFGDEPYRPVTLFSLLVETDPATLVLVRSLLIDVLNLAERVIPTLTPQNLADSRPRMRPLI